MLGNFVQVKVVIVWFSNKIMNIVLTSGGTTDKLWQCHSLEVWLWYFSWESQSKFYDQMGQ